MREGSELTKRVTLSVPKVLFRIQYVLCIYP